MPDVFTKEKRSQVMSRIRGKGNKATELALARLFRQNKITGWRRHQDVFGRPDFLFKEARIALFVDGCFWHGCAEHCRQPAGNASFWLKKLSSNKSRDKKVTQHLRKAGWRVVRIWEHELAKKNRTRFVKKLTKIFSRRVRQT